MPKRSSRLICAGSTGKMILAQVESMWPISLRSVTALAAKRPYPERAAGPCAELAHLEEAHRNAHGASRAGAGWSLHPLRTKFCDSLTLWLADRPPWRRAQQMIRLVVWYPGVVGNAVVLQTGEGGKSGRSGRSWRSSPILPIAARAPTRPRQLGRVM